LLRRIRVPDPGSTAGATLAGAGGAGLATTGTFTLARAAGAGFPGIVVGAFAG